MLSDLFCISTGTGSRIVITWLLFLSKELLFLLLCTTTADLDGILKPKELRGIENLRAIIDCTEFHFTLVMCQSYSMVASVIKKLLKKVDFWISLSLEML